MGWWALPLIVGLLLIAVGCGLAASREWDRIGGWRK